MKEKHVVGLFAEDTWELDTRTPSLTFRCEKCGEPLLLEKRLD